MLLNFDFIKKQLVVKNLYAPTTSLTTDSNMAYIYKTGRLEMQSARMRPHQRRKCQMRKHLFCDGTALTVSQRCPVQIRNFTCCAQLCSLHRSSLVTWRKPDWRPVRNNQPQHLRSCV